MSSAGVVSFEKEHLWMYLQALGFEPGPATIACGKIVSLTHFGVFRKQRRATINEKQRKALKYKVKLLHFCRICYGNMFDKLNRDAFQIVAYFLFQTLDQSLSKEVFKFCWPPFDQKRDAEFRKHCCEWLKKISVECGGSFPQVVGSLFMSPGGPKFIHLMYHFARYVAIKYIKTYSKKSPVRFMDTFNVKPQDAHKCIARCLVARNRFLQILQREDCVIQKYQENARLSVKQIRELRAECVGLQNHIKKLEPYDDQSNLQEKVQKVRSLWASVNETLMFLEKEREVVSSVLSLANQYCLDGTNVAITIPKLLLDRLEQQMDQLHIGNVYKAGKLNLLTVIQLLNEVLKIMRCEHCQANTATDQARLIIDLHYLEKETRFQRERLSHLKHMRCKMKEDLTSLRRSVMEKQGEWYNKWKKFLGLSPFSLIKSCTPAVDLLPPMTPLSFDPASEEVYTRSILFKYPASLPDASKQCNQENDCSRENDTWGAINEPANSPASFLLQSAPLSDRNSVILPEKDTKMKTPRKENETISEKTLELEDCPSTEKAKNTESSAVGGSLPARKSDPFQKEQDHLVEEVARAVLSDSPKLPEGKEVQLEKLIDSLISNPFLTRNQIPRTPENLITEIRSSWRKAIEMEDDRGAGPVQRDTECREVLPEASPLLPNQTESSMASLLSPTAVSDFSQSHLPEEKVVSDCFKCVSQKHVTASHIGDPPTQNQSDLLHKIVFKQDLECMGLQTKLSEASQIVSPLVLSRIGVGDGSKEESAEVSGHSHTSHKEPSLQKTILWNSFQLPSGVSSKSFDTDFGILHETLPEEVGHLSLDSSNNTEANFELELNSPRHVGIFPEDVGGIQTMPESNFSLQSVCSRSEALKKSFSKKKEESYLSYPEILERHKPELSLTPSNMQTDDTFNFLGSHDSHTDFVKPSLRMSFGERKRSLSPLIKFSPEEQRLRTTIPYSLGEVLPKLKEEEILNKLLDAEKSPSDLKR